MKTLGSIAHAYQTLQEFWESPRTAYLLSVMLVSVFGASMAVATLNYGHWLGLRGLLGRVHFLQAVEISFTLLLFFEMIGLVFVIPQSIANSIGKQIEILSLILLRSSFKEFSHYNFQLPLQGQLESVYKMVSDGVGGLFVFLLLSVYYGVQRHRAITPQADRLKFVALKQILALLVLLALLGLSAYDVYHMLVRGVWVQSADRFYLILIFADLLYSCSSPFATRCTTPIFFGTRPLCSSRSLFGFRCWPRCITTPCWASFRARLPSAWCISTPCSPTDDSTT